MTPHPTRRRFLSISAATMALTGQAFAKPPVARWQGRALGAPASLQLVGLEAWDAAPLFAALQKEILRLERIFSLYRADSALSRLNRAGQLRAPPPDLLALLGTCGHLNAASEGAFDPTIQPVFVQQAIAAEEGRALSDANFSAAIASVGWDGVRFDAQSVTLLRPGAALTLNGIAQGYITDRIADLLRGEGYGDVMVDMGEIAARGTRADGGRWRAGIADPQGVLLKRLTLTDRALATSAPKGTVLDAAGRVGHIFDPQTGQEAGACAITSVSSPGATLADGLSTALCVLPRARHRAFVARFPEARIELAT